MFYSLVIAVFISKPGNSNGKNEMLVIIATYSCGGRQLSEVVSPVAHTSMLCSNCVCFQSLRRCHFKAVWAAHLQPLLLPTQLALQVKRVLNEQHAAPLLNANKTDSQSCRLASQPASQHKCVYVCVCVFV